MDSQEEEKLLSVWDIARRTVESFDKSIITVRQMYLVIIGIIAAGSASLIDEKQFDEIAFILFLISSALVLMTFIFWGLDLHYHNYLRIGAETAARVERKLGLEKDRFAISIELGNYRRNESFLAITYPIFYSFVWLGSLALMSITIPKIDTTNGWLLNSVLLASIIGFLIMAIYFFGKVGDKKVDKFLNPQKYEIINIDEDILTNSSDLSLNELSTIQEIIYKTRRSRLITQSSRTILFGTTILIFLIITNSLFNFDIEIFIGLFLGSSLIIGFGIGLLIWSFGRSIFINIRNKY